VLGHAGSYAGPGHAGGAESGHAWKSQSDCQDRGRAWQMLLTTSSTLILSPRLLS